MAPPVSVSQSWRGAPAVAPGTNRPDVLPSSTTIAPSGRVAPTAAASDSVVSAPVGRLGPSRRCRAAPVGRRAHAPRPGPPGRRPRPRRDGPACARCSPPGPGRSPCRGRRRRTPGTWRRPGPGGARRRAAPGPSRPGRPAARRRGCPPRVQVGREGLAQQRGAGRPGDPAGGVQPVGPQRACHPAAAPPARPSAGPWPPRRPCRPAPRRPAARPWRARAGGGLGPRRVGRQDQGGHAAGRPQRGGDRVRGVRGHVVGPGGRAVPARDGAGDGRDVGLERRVVAPWYVAWSPTMLTIGVRARRALCRLASPLPRPGPRCSSVAAGRPAIRP